MLNPLADVLSYSLFLLGLITEVGSQNDIRYPPKIVSPVSDAVLYLNKENSFHIVCRAEGIPKPSYKWLRNGKIFVQNSQVKFNNVTGNLTFEKFSREVEGDYQCVATNVFINNDGSNSSASCLSMVVTLIQARAENFKDPDQIRYKNTTEYKFFNMSCPGEGEILDTNLYYKWFVTKGNKLIQQDGPLHYIDVKGSFYYPYVPPLAEGADVRSRYICGVVLQNLGQVKLSRVTELTVARTEAVSVIPPKIQYIRSYVKGMKFGEAKLECVASGYDPTEPHVPVITWYNPDGTKITNKTGKYKLSSYNRTLTIKQLDERDEKKYFCGAENSGGTTKRKSAFLNVTAPPIFNKEGGSPKDHTLPEGKDATFNCKAHSARSERPPDEPVWYINGLRTGTHTDPFKYKFKDERKQLIVKNVKKATDILCVQCEVSNSEGTIRNNGCINVLLAIKITKRPSKRLSIVYGDIVDLTVLATGDPSVELTFTWEFRGLKYERDEAPPFVKYDPKTLAATIDTNLLSDSQYENISGIYTRYVFHQYEKRSIKSDVILEDKKPSKLESLAFGIATWIRGNLLAILFFASLSMILNCLFLILLKTVSKEEQSEGEGEEAFYQASIQNKTEETEETGYETLMSDTTYTTYTTEFDTVSHSTRV